MMVKTGKWGKGQGANNVGKRKMGSNRKAVLVSVEKMYMLEITKTPGKRL